MKLIFRFCKTALLLLAIFASGAARAAWYPQFVYETVPPFAAGGERKLLEYIPVPKAERPWDVCVSLPHLKDAYWLGVDYGVVEEAKRQGIKLHVFEAGGYANLQVQIDQIEACVAKGAQAVVVGAVSTSGLNTLVKSLTSRKIPVIDLVNGISSPYITAKSQVPFNEMGEAIGKYLAKRHPRGSIKTKVAWLPGPEGAGWVSAANKGFMDATSWSALEILPPIYGDTGKQVQGDLIRRVLSRNPDVSYIVGTGVTAEVGVGILKELHKEGTIKLLSFYMTPSVYDAIRGGQVLASPVDFMAIQGRIAIDQAVRALEGKALHSDVGPVVFTVDNDNIGRFKIDDFLAPPSFSAILEVNPPPLNSNGTNSVARKGGSK